MKDLIKQIMLRLGVSEAVATQLLALIKEDVEAPKEVVLDTVIADATKKLQTSFKADKSFMDPIHQEVNGKLFDVIDAKLKKAFGVTDDEYEALPKLKRTDALVEACAKKIVEKAGDPDAKDKEILTLNEKLKTIKGELKQLKEVELPAAKSAGEQEREGIRLEQAVGKLLRSGADGKGKESDLLVKEEFATPAVMAQLRAKYDLKLQADGTVKLFKKDGSGEVFDGEHNPMSIFKEIRTIGTDAGLFKLNNGAAAKKGEGEGAGKGAGAGTGEGEGERQVRVPPGVERARARAAEMKEGIKAAKVVGEGAEV